MDTFEDAIERSEKIYLNKTTPEPQGSKTNNMLDEAGSIFGDQQTPQQPKKNVFQKMAGAADAVNRFKQNQQAGGTIGAVAHATPQRTEQPEVDQNSLFTQQPQQPARTQQPQQAQQPQANIQAQQQFNQLPPDAQKAFGTAATFENIMKVMKQNNIQPQ